MKNLNFSIFFNPGDIYISTNYKNNVRPVIVIKDLGDSCIVSPIISNNLSNLNKKREEFLYLIKSFRFDNIQSYIYLDKTISIKKNVIKKKIGSLEKNELSVINDKIEKLYINNLNSLELTRYASEELSKIDKNINAYLSESEITPLTTKFDIFLSHSSIDKMEVAGIKAFLNTKGISVYVDWIDPHLNRANVTRQSAETMRIRMKNSKCLLFAFSKNSYKSIWMPWELGFFDGLERNIAVIPIERVPFFKKKFKGQEYLNLYDYIGHQNMKNY